LWRYSVKESGVKLSEVAVGVASILSFSL
jgi:hypothetical protein